MSIIIRRGGACVIDPAQSSHLVTPDSPPSHDKAPPPHASSACRSCHTPRKVRDDATHTVRVSYTRRCLLTPHQYYGRRKTNEFNFLNVILCGKCGKEKKT